MRVVSVWEAPSCSRVKQYVNLTDCWAEVYVENLSGVPVWFDDLEIQTGALPTALVVQETHYDPWGLELAGIGYIADATLEHQWKFNGGVERLTDLALGLDQSGARMYDPRLGRFWSVDPLADQEDQESWTPYHFVSDNPVGANDPDGTCEGCRSALNAVLEFSHGVMNAVANNNSTLPDGQALIPRAQSSSAAFNAGQTTGDVLTLVQGAYQMAAGLVATGTGGAVELVTIGGATPVAVPVAVVGTAVAVHGAVVAGNALANLSRPNQNSVNINGNSKSSNKPQHGYAIREKKTNKVQEYGVSGQKLNKDGTSPRVAQKLNTKYKGRTDVEGVVLKPKIGPKNGRTARENGLNWEQGNVNSYARSRKNPDKSGRKGPNEQQRPQPE